MIKKLLPILLVTVNSLFAQQRLLMFGGGKRTPDAVLKLVGYSGGDTGNILVITWASSEQAATYESIKKDITAVSKIKVEAAPFSPLNAEKKALLIDQLKTAKSVFFTGGDQNRIMDVLKDAELFNLLKAMYTKGIVFAGTSAGTAIMSDIMITGKGNLEVIDGTQTETSKGLGLVSNMIVDQHFIKRQRQNRLISVLLLHPTLLGIGIDENTAVAIEQNRYMEVLGDSEVMVFEPLKKPNQMRFTLLKKGDTFDLKKRKTY